MNKAAFRKLMADLNIKLSTAEKNSEYKHAECVFVYISVGDEVSTGKLISKMFSDGKRVCVPLCYGKGIMDAVEISSEEELVPGKYNIPEPADKTRVVDASELDLIIVPGVAFDEKGLRLGRGGGYYDRFLKNAVNAKKVAVCRDINFVEEVPHEDHDESVDIIISETRIKKI